MWTTTVVLATSVMPRTATFVEESIQLEVERVGEEELATFGLDVEVVEDRVVQFTY